MLKQQQVDIYTDGSCDTKVKTGAWVAVIIKDNKKKILSGVETTTTHNRMELLSVIKSVEYVTREQPVIELTIYSDSQYVVNLPLRIHKLKENNFYSKKGVPIQNTDLIQALIHQLEKYSIRLIKVKAHQKSDVPGSEYNREADKLSRKLVRDQVKQRHE